MGFTDKAQRIVIRKKLKELKTKHEKEKKMIEKSAKSNQKQRKSGKLKSMFT